MSRVASAFRPGHLPEAFVAPILLYRTRCAKCRVFSALLVFLSAGELRRVPYDCPEALQLYEHFGATHGRLALVVWDGMYEGPIVFTVAWRAALAALARRLEQLWAGRRARGEGASS